jgi:hypothetical protein
MTAIQQATLFVLRVEKNIQLVAHSVLAVDTKTESKLKKNEKL